MQYPGILAFLLLLVLTIWGCATPFSPSEINSLQKVEFEPLSIQSDVELYNFRIDIIRQTYTETVDSTSETKEVDYHPVGFNLGNGLFYDLNDNLSLRVDQLAGFNPETDFKLEKAYNGKITKNVIYANKEGTFSEKTFFRDQGVPLFMVNRFEDSLSITRKNKHMYSVIKNDTAIIYRSPRKVIDNVQKREENQYQQAYKNKVEDFQIREGVITLKNKYEISINQNKNTLEIKSIRKKDNQILYSMVKDGQNLVIYNTQYFGKKIELKDDKLVLFFNNKYGYEYKFAK